MQIANNLGKQENIEIRLIYRDYYSSKSCELEQYDSYKIFVGVKNIR